MVTINQPLAEAQKPRSSSTRRWRTCGSHGEDADLLAEGTITLHRGQTFEDTLAAGADTVGTRPPSGRRLLPFSGEAYSREPRLNGEAVRSLDTSMGRAGR